ncbi:MAG TPA: ABC transporter permease [Vicinamibacterales bacterium]|nr:ABC transporter permease [Vicinamibacterales bacterium]
MRWLVQSVSVTLLNLRSLPNRLGSSLVAVIGIAGVVIVFVAVLSIGEGFRAAMRAAGAPDRALVMRAGSDSEMTSILTGDDVRIVADAPGVARGATGALASPELFVVVDVPKRSTGTPANVPLRGILPEAFDVRREASIVEGRRFQPGRHEVIVGRAASRQFSGLELGRTVRWGRTEWTIVGIFEADDSASEGEIWCDARVLQPAYRRGNSFQSVLVRLESPAAFDRFKDALTTDPRLNVMVRREPDYYAEQSQAIHRLITIVGSIVAGLMGIGAVFGAVNTMYTAVAARAREIATLRALGFGRLSVVASVVGEALTLAAVGGLAGGLLAWLLFDGYRTSTLNWQTFSQVTFAFAVTPGLLGRGLAYALVMGLLGAVLPAIRAALLPIPAALREP